MNILLKKMLRDMKNSWTQFIAIFLMAILGVFIYSGLSATGNGMREIGDKFYRDTNSAHMWVISKSVEEKDVEAVKDIEGVRASQRRMMINGKVESDNDAEIELMAVDKADISKPLLIEGEEFDTKSDGLWISEKFAQAKDYKVGDKLKINILEEDIEFEIKGLVLSSEHVEHFGSLNEIKPQHDKYTFGFISPELIKNRFNGFPYNQLLVTLDDDVEKSILNQDIENLFGDRFIKSLDREEHLSFSGLSGRVDQFDLLSTIFPSVFFLLSLLTMFTTMTRLIEKQRSEIGILSSLGYSRSKIMIHFLSYGLWIGLIGGLIGVITGPLVIPSVIYEMLKAFYILPSWQASVLPQSYIVVGVIALCCIASTWIACSKELNDMPAVILRGRPPKSGKHIFLEKIKGVWNRLSFENKWFVRDLGRNKSRSLMGVIGVMGCMMLIVAGMGMEDSVYESIKLVYREQYLYKEKVVGQGLDLSLKNDLTSKDEFIEEKYTKIFNDSEKQSGLLTILEDKELVKLEDIKGRELILDRGDLAITNKIAKELNLKVGDKVEWKISGESDKEISKITYILNSPSPQGIYLNRESFEDKGYEFNPTSLLTSKDSNINKGKILKYDGVEDIISKDTYEEDSEKMLDSTITIVYMLIAAGIVLGGVILYNLGMLNYTERIREFATLKVLGFYPREIRSLIVRENIVLTIIGWAIGIPIGLLFLKVYMGIVSAANMEFIAYVTRRTLIISSLITIGCSIGVNYALSLKIGKINMVESLKSVE